MNAAGWCRLGRNIDHSVVPMLNPTKIFPRQYNVLMVNQDGSTYTFRHWWVGSFKRGVVGIVHRVAQWEFVEMEATIQ